MQLTSKSDDVRLLTTLSITLCLLSPLLAVAADSTWNGGSTGGTTVNYWNNTTNWVGSVVPGAGGNNTNSSDVATFSEVGTTRPTVDISSGINGRFQTIGKIVVDANQTNTDMRLFSSQVTNGGNFRIDGVSGVGIDMSSAVKQFSFGSVGANNDYLLAVQNDQSWDVTSATSGANLNVRYSSPSNGITLSLQNQGSSAATALTLNVGSGRSVFIDGPMIGAGSLIKTNAGTLQMSGTNTYAGVTTIQEGVLRILNPSALGLTNAGTIVETGASLVLTNGLTLAGEPLTLNGIGNDIFNNLGALRTTGTANPTTVASPITLGSNARIRPADGGEMILTGPITDNGNGYNLTLNAQTAGTILRMNSASNTAGTLTLFGVTNTAGLITFGVNNVFPTSRLALGGGLFDLNGTDQTFAGLTNGFNPTYGLLTNSSATLSTLTIDYSGASASQMETPIAGNVEIVKEGTGAQIFGGSGVVYSYSGSTTINAGSLRIDNDTALGATSAGTVVESGASLAVNNGLTLVNEPLTLNGNGSFDNNGALRTSGTASPTTVSCPITLGSDTRIRPTDGGTLTLSGPITDNGSNYMLTLNAQAANSVLIVNSASNTVDAVRTFSSGGGLIQFGTNNAFPSSILEIGAGLIDLNGTGQTFAGLSTGTTPEDGVVTNSSGTLVTLTINYTNASPASVLSSTLAGLLNVVKTGGGVQSFGGGAAIAHSYRGTTIVSGGVLSVNCDMSRVTNNVIVNSGGTLRSSGGWVIGGPVTVNAGGAFYAGFATNLIGTLTISNNLTLAGNTIVALNKDLAQSNDVINVTGTLAYGGTLTVLNTSSNDTPFVVGDKFAVFPAVGGTRSGSFTTIATDGTTFGFNTTNGTLTVLSTGSRLLTSEGFDASGYATGVSLIDNATLGYGFDGPWTGFGGQVKILTNSLVYSGYGADGEQRVQLTNNSAIRRSLLTGNNGPLGNYMNTNGLISISRNGMPLYMSFLMASPTNLPGGNFSLYSGDYSTSNRFFMAQLGTTAPFAITATAPSTGAAQTLGNNNNAANLVVARFDFAGTNGTARFWLNPLTAGSEPAANATLTNLSVAFDRLQLTHGFATGMVEFDEIRFGNDWSNTVKTAGLATLPGITNLGGLRELPPSPLGSTNYPREFFPFVDAFGQYRHLEWSNKVHSVVELLQSKTNELADLAANPGPDHWCSYGGWLNGPQLAPTGFFRLQKYLGNWWFVDPHGHLFWSHGVTGANAPGDPTGVTQRQNYFANLPLPGDASDQFYGPFGNTVGDGFYQYSNPQVMDFAAANALLKYGPNWATDTLALHHTRLRSWGMNTIGSWTATNTYLIPTNRTPYARVFSPFVGSINGDSRMPDYFNPAFATAVTNVLSGPERNDPFCIGFYIGNELPWTRPSDVASIREIGSNTLAAASTAFAKIAFQEQLIAKYTNHTALNTQWSTGYGSWADFLNQQSTYPGAGGNADLDAFYRNYAEQFFSTCGDIIHGYTSNLFLGSRFAGNPHLAAAQACTNHVDVVTYNNFVDNVFIPNGLESVDIPVLNTEHNFNAPDTGLFWQAFNVNKPAKSNQVARASFYSGHFNGAITNSRFVGQYWYQLFDRSTAGTLRADEDANNNNGLVDVTGTPYAPVIGAARTAGQSMYSTRLGTTPPTITAITNRTININANTGPIAFTIGDDLTAAASLVLSRASSNTNLVTTNNIVFGGSGASRTVTVTPLIGQTGTTTITITVTDASGARGFATFDLTVVQLASPPVFTGPSISNQLFKVTITGTSGLNYYIQASTNIATTNWQTLFTNLNATTPFVWSDPQTTNFNRRFYRVLIGP